MSSYDSIDLGKAAGLMVAGNAMLNFGTFVYAINEQINCGETIGCDGKEEAANWIAFFGRLFALSGSYGLLHASRSWSNFAIGLWMAFGLTFVGLGMIVGEQFFRATLFEEAHTALHSMGPTGAAMYDIIGYAQWDNGYWICAFANFMGVMSSILLALAASANDPARSRETNCFLRAAGAGFVANGFVYFIGLAVVLSGMYKVCNYMNDGGSSACRIPFGVSAGLFIGLFGTLPYTLGGALLVRGQHTSDAEGSLVGAGGRPSHVNYPTFQGDAGAHTGHTAPNDNV